jgi:hypothetical protein
MSFRCRPKSWLSQLLGLDVPHRRQRPEKLPIRRSSTDLIVPMPIRLLPPSGK